ncbi:hypothetical protein CQ062_13470 [Ochrobactrum sp. MYb68]|nr:hypothetical protein CQ062_13470 [Ochrobactrum sp. MYb68]
MDNWLKVLIAAACVVIVAGSAYFGINEYRWQRERSRIVNDRTEMVACQGTLTKAGSHLIQMREDCLKRGLITQEDYYRANSGEYRE